MWERLKVAVFVNLRTICKGLLELVLVELLGSITLECELHPNHITHNISKRYWKPGVP